MREFQVDRSEDHFDSDLDSLVFKPPPAPIATTRLEQPTLSSRVTSSGFRRNPLPEQTTGGWNSSTQVPRGIAKPLKHQILCRNYVPQVSVAPERKSTTEVVDRLSKATISSRLKGAAATLDAHEPPRRVEVDRKRLHMQQRQHPSAKQNTQNEGTSAARCGREAIELLLYYRKEVDKRLRADPLYGLHQDIQS